MFTKVRNGAVTTLAAILCLYTLCEVNYPRLLPQSALAIFTMLGLVICFLVRPTFTPPKDQELPSWKRYTRVGH